MKFLLSTCAASILISGAVHAATIAMEDQSQIKVPAPADHITYFEPPQQSELPDNAYGKMVMDGYALFVDTKRQAPQFVGNGLTAPTATWIRAAWPTRPPCGAHTPCTRRTERRTTRSIPLPNACRAAFNSA